MRTEQKLFYVLKTTHLQRFEGELRALRSRINTLHELELRAPEPDHDSLEELDKSYLTLISSVQLLRESVSKTLAATDEETQARA